MNIVNQRNQVIKNESVKKLGFRIEEGKTSKDWSVFGNIKVLRHLAWDQVPDLNPFLYWTDSYKDSHIFFEVGGVNKIYSNMTARFDKYMKDLLGSAYDSKFVVFGLQWMLLRLDIMADKGFFSKEKESVMNDMLETHRNYLNNDKIEQFAELHDLGYLPIIVKALPEGTIAPIGTPFFTIENTHEDFEWLANYLESGISTDLWKQMTVATVARAYYETSKKFALETQGNIEGVAFQNHDFSTRGQSGFESGAINGLAFALFSLGSDNKPSIWAAKHFYGTVVDAERPLVLSVPAGEHSVTTLGILTTQRRYKEQGIDITLSEAEKIYTKWVMTEQFPTGIVSFVADSFDYWNFVTKIVPSLKNDILARDGKFVVRGDSGNPVHIIAGYKHDGITYNWDKDTVDSLAKELYESGYECAYFNGMGFSEIYKSSDFDETYLFGNPLTTAEVKGTIQCLWEIFGGTVNELGYKHLDSHIGMIYGDGITVQRSEEILTRLMDKGFASTNIVFGAGSYSLNMLSRDHLGMAIKATNADVVIGDEVVSTPIYKDPKTDKSKKSARGRLVVIKEDNGSIVTKDMQSEHDSNFVGMLETVYMNGQFHKLETVHTIRERLGSKF